MKFSVRNVFGLASSLVVGIALLGFSGQAVGEEYDEDTYGPEAPIIFVKPVKAVDFSHKVHTMDAGLECDSCHDDLFEMEAGVAEEKGDFTMQALYDGQYCGACHDGDMAFASNTRCTICHIGVKGYEKINGIEAPAHH